MITKRDKEILNHIISYIQEHGYPPNYTEIGEMVGIRSRSSIYHHMQKLLAAGLLETDAEPGSPRAIRVPGWKFVKVDQESQTDQPSDQESSRHVRSGSRTG